RARRPAAEAGYGQEGAGRDRRGPRRRRGVRLVVPEQVQARSRKTCAIEPTAKRGAAERGRNRARRPLGGAVLQRSGRVREEPLDRVPAPDRVVALLAAAPPSADR